MNERPPQFANENFRLRVVLEYPFLRKCIACDMDLSGTTFESFMPLDRNHDVPFDFEAIKHGHEQREKRRILADHVAREIAHKLIEMLEKQDPSKGYEKEDA